ncbi:hypothetical protein EDB89DRAFT_1981930 [Lactarius sanguifluus]|nr:hypothetical protein EDB89DRAFT_1981930 [Lactarius sanguifluus]
MHDVLCIPGPAIAVERIFSGGQDTISLRRASLRADSIRILILVKKQLHLARAKAKASLRSLHRSCYILCFPNLLNTTHLLTRLPYDGRTRTRPSPLELCSADLMDGRQMYKPVGRPSIVRPYPSDGTVRSPTQAFPSLVSTFFPTSDT